jgi:flagellar motor switch protein FliG
MKRETDGLRKVAIFVASLDRRSADRVLDRMDPAQAGEVRRIAAEMDTIDPQEQRRIIDEFLRLRPMVPQKQPPGIELDDRLARILLSPPRPFSTEPAEPVERAEAAEPRPAAGPPFHFLHDAEGEKLARLLASERGQTIALVLSHLPPRQAGNVLVRLSPALQADVIRRLVDLEETEPEILHDVERALESRFSQQVEMQRRRVAGLSAVAGILKATDAPVGRRILANLASHDRALAQRLRPRAIEFDDLARLDDLALATVFRAAETPLVILALTGERPYVVERVLAALPEPEAGFVRNQLEHPGPTRLSDVEQARQWIAELAEQLAAEGQIELRRDARPARPAVLTA